jgi:hypothetical protein
MHVKDHLLRAFIDQELSEKQADQVKEHLRRCPNCTQHLVELQTRAKTVNNQLDRLAPTARELPRSSQTAYHQFSKVRKEIPPTMFTKRPFWTVLGVVAVLVIAFSFTPVRAWASNLLSLFRVQQITVVSFDPQAARQGRDNLANSEDTIRQLFKDNLEVVDQGDVQKLSDPDDAAKATGFLPRTPAVNEKPQFFVKPGMQAKFTIDQPTLQSLIDAAGIDIQIPEGMDGQVVTLDVPAALVTVYGGCEVDEQSDMLPAGCTALAQLPSPSLSAPEGLDVPKMGEAMLQFLGYSPAEARSMSERIDWTTTLILPIPQGEGITYQDVTADGVPATFLTQRDSDQYVLIWVKGGMLYALQGNGTLADAQALANLH